MDKHIEIIRSACHKANPSIKDLVIGCKVWISGYPEVATVLYKSFSFFTFLFELGNESYTENIFQDQIARDIDSGDIIVLGRDIRLADVLLAIQKSDRNWEFEDAGMSVELNRNDTTLEFNTNEMGWTKWNLLKDRLEDQSPECLEFIANLLK